jgi:hypothetical protein
MKVFGLCQSLNEPPFAGLLDGEDIYAFNAAKGVEVRLPWTHQHNLATSTKLDLTN